VYGTIVAPGDKRGDDNGEGPETTPPENQSPLDPETQAYLDEVDDINSEIQTLRTELNSTNAGFDADPREVEFSETLSRFESAEESTQELAERQSDLTPPAGLEGNHLSLQTALERFDAQADTWVRAAEDDAGTR
jgi:hypothetical protein